MNQSNEIKDLIAAMAKLLLEVEQPKKRSINPFHKSKYADLGECFDCIRGLLPKHQFLLTQLVMQTHLETKLFHVPTGQWLASEFPLPRGEATAQQIGSMVTYGRRYSICAMFNLIAENDDDGNAASVKPEAASSQAAASRAAFVAKTKGGAA